jgi:hypothetical protein
MVVCPPPLSPAQSHGEGAHLPSAMIEAPFRPSVVILWIEKLSLLCSECWCRAHPYGGGPPRDVRGEVPLPWLPLSGFDRKAVVRHFRHWIAITQFNNSKRESSMGMTKVLYGIALLPLRAPRVGGAASFGAPPLTKPSKRAQLHRAQPFLPNMEC